VIGRLWGRSAVEVDQAPGRKPAALPRFTRYNLALCCCRGFLPLLYSKSGRGTVTIDRRDIAMPMYDYQCASCGHQLEAIQKISAAPLVDCPACQAPELKKMLSMPGFRLSGSGWYETDFKTGSKKNLAGGDKTD
jgi:putative FmdB family regulatory protein